MELTLDLGRRVGFELELLAPKGASRLTLAAALAAHFGGEVRSIWHQDSEPVPLESIGNRFLHLTRGFEVVRPDGLTLVSLVDDITIAAELDPRSAAPDGWYRILTDDSRLLRLLSRHCSPSSPLSTVLDAFGSLWGSVPELSGSIWRVESAGATLAMAAPLGGERERPCELVTPPIASDHLERLDELLTLAQSLGFVVPIEAAVHLHVDGAPFHSLGPFANLIRLFGLWREPLRRVLQTNPACTRLAALPAALLDAAEAVTDLLALQAVAREAGITKFFDINLTALLTDDPWRDTVEIRILPGSLSATEVMAKASIICALLDRCLLTEAIPSPPDDASEADASLLLLIAND